jgi:cytochrome b561
VTDSARRTFGEAVLRGVHVLRAERTIGGAAQRLGSGVSGFAPARNLSEVRGHRLPSLSHRSFLILLVMVGVTGVISDSWRAAELPWVSVHAWLVLLLPGLVVARFHWQLQQLPALQRRELRELVRRQSRTIYLLLYVLLFARESLGIADDVWRHGPLDIGQLPDYLAASAENVIAGIGCDLRGYLACAILALALIRVLAALYGRVGGEGRSTTGPNVTR